MRDNLILRGNTYHVRLALPADVRPFFGNRKLLSQSLKTGLQQEAKDRARAILLDWKDQIAQARQTQLSQAEQWRGELATQANALATSADNSLLSTLRHKPSPSDPFFALSETEQNAKLAEATAEFAKAVGILFDDGATSLPPNLIPSLQAARKADHIGFLSSALGSLPSAFAQITSRRYNLSPTETEEALSIAIDPKTYKPKSPITKSMLDSWAVHLATQIKTEKTRDRLKKSMQRFSDYLTSEGKPLTFDTVHNFLGTLPAARQTRANYLWAGRTFWKWANKYQQAFREQFQYQQCPFNGHELPRTGEAAGLKRLAFSVQEVEILHRKALEKGRTPLAHLIQFAAYTGARLEEIGRIKPEHTIIDSAGEPIGFKITESKTDAGIREMPLHPALVPLLKELSAHALENGGYLFPGGHNKYGNRLDGLSKQFGRLKAKDFGKEHTFHSIRHSVTTLLHQAGVSIEILPYILGHETGAFTLAQYSKGPSFQQKQEAIRLLAFDFN